MTNTLTMIKRVARRPMGLVVCVIAVVVFAAYYRALQLGFYGDDWIFYELAGRLSLPEYLTKYFDPRIQTAWYRPVQGVLFRIEYVLFGTNAQGFHWVNVLLHLANCYWLLAIMQRVTQNWKLTLSAVLLFATLPVAALSVFWPGVVDSLEAFFYLASIFFWLKYLQAQRVHDYGLAFVAFLFALFSKEIGVTLPITLLFIDRCVIAKPTTLRALVRRYIGFVLVWLAYLPIEWVAISRSVFISHEGYSPSLNVLSNLVDYLAALVFPWTAIPIFSQIWLVVVGLALAFLIIFKKKYFLLPLAVSAVLVILPVTPFPFVATRFLYVASVASAILYGLLFAWVVSRARIISLAILGMVILIGAWSISNAAGDFGEWARVARVPFRNVSQAHPTFVEDSYLYFINPPVPITNLSGMFFWRYGTRVAVGGDDIAKPAGLRDHAVAFVYVFDEQGNQKELTVDKQIISHVAPTLPITFANGIQLEGYELVNANIKRGDPIVLLFYWRGLQPIDEDYAIVVRLLDTAGKPIVNYAKEPHLGKAPTSGWQPGQLIVDAIQLPLVPDVAVGRYRLEIQMTDPSGKAFANQVSIEPVNILE